ncbi:hypothetical protein V490_06809 [Pseudogymnoascus sp. VKM F-3557]|nr:hypothetical protein V490_06809 [Pseudogymnoascus sp. VKM F-3557]
MEASDLQKGHYVAMNGRPYEVVDKSSHHGSVDLVFIDIFTGNPLRYQASSGDYFNLTDVVKKDSTIKSYIEDDFLHLVESDGTENNNVKVPEGDLGVKIREYEESGTNIVITVLSAMGMEGAVHVREAPRN